MKDGGGMPAGNMLGRAADQGHWVQVLVELVRSLLVAVELELAPQTDVVPVLGGPEEQEPSRS